MLTRKVSVFLHATFHTQVRCAQLNKLQNILMTIKYEKPLRYLKPLRPEHFEDLDKIKWFSNCGKEASYTPKHNFRRLDLSSAITSCNSVEWENFQLEKRNELTAFLNRTRKNEFTEWNIVTVALKKYFENGVFKIVNEHLANRNLPDSILDSVKWDILSYSQEIAYKKYNIPKFYSHLISIYTNGYLPCGYEGSFPNGTFLIY